MYGHVRDASSINSFTGGIWGVCYWSLIFYVRMYSSLFFFVNVYVRTRGLLQVARGWMLCKCTFSEISCSAMWWVRECAYVAAICVMVRVLWSARNMSFREGNGKRIL